MYYAESTCVLDSHRVSHQCTSEQSPKNGVSKSKEQLG